MGEDRHPGTERDIDPADPEWYLNRELSELAFQRRVLHEAEDERNPLLERVRFLGLFTRNLDEFFMKRVGGLKQQIQAGVSERTPDGMTPRAQWEAVLDEAAPMLDRQSACFHETIRPALADAGIHLLEYEDLTEPERMRLRSYFEESVLPTLTPLSFDPAHPFPFISNLSLSLGVMTRRGPDEEPRFTRIKVPPNRPRLVPVDGKGPGHAVGTANATRFVPLEAVIRGNLELLFPNVDILATGCFRLTRNAEVRRDEEVAEDLMEVIEEVIEQRRFATVVRLEVEERMPEGMRATLVRQLDVEDREVFDRPIPIDFRDFMSLESLDRPELSRKPWTPKPHPRFPAERTGLDPLEEPNDPDIFQSIEENDILLHHPYHSFDDTIQRFLDRAATDPDVLAIKAAIYRTASDSQVIQTLIEAAENGKQVAVMVELKARFDEQNNLEWVRTLEEHGIHVAYGTVGLKTHTKTALVVREEEAGVSLYSHVGTGNYHSETATEYIDLGLLTADRDIGHDLVTVFNFFTGPDLHEKFRKLLIAPETMRSSFTEMIRREAEHARNGRPGRIVVKVNGLEDPAIVRELYAAAQAGVDIDLIVRDICRLRPGIEGLSESIDVYSVVGPFLEHSRIFYFGNDGDPSYFIGSADWMTRNLDYRVEAVTPVEDPRLCAQLRFVLRLMLSDNRRCWEMAPDGSYNQRQPGKDAVIDTQAILMAEATRAATGEESAVGIPGTHDLPDHGLINDGDGRTD